MEIVGLGDQLVNPVVDVAGLTEIGEHRMAAPVDNRSTNTGPLHVAADDHHEFEPIVFGSELHDAPRRLEEEPDLGGFDVDGSAVVDRIDEHLRDDPVLIRPSSEILVERLRGLAHVPLAGASETSVALRADPPRHESSVPRVRQPDYGRRMITTFEVNRDDRAVTRAVEQTIELEPGQVLARIDHFALTSNNVTYSVIGHLMGYWDFFPADAGWGRVPAFGHAEIVESRCDGVEPGARVYGYLPMASHVVFEPGRINPHSFHDMAAHRQPMSDVYNRYALTSADPLHDPEREAQRMLLHPLFMTSFVIDDWCGDNELFGANTVVLSSASSKTAVGVAHLMSRRDGVHVVGLTSPGNLDFTTSLGCYDQVVTYDAVGTLDNGPAVYIDMSAAGELRHAVHTHFGDNLKASSSVGATDWEHMGAGAELPGPTPELFFAPTQIEKRNAEWGREEMERRILDAWTTYSAWTDDWMTVVHHDGPDELAALWADMLPGRVDPALGHVVRISS